MKARTNPNTGERRAQVLQAQRQLYEDEFRKLEKYGLIKFITFLPRY